MHRQYSAKLSTDSPRLTGLYDTRNMMRGLFSDYTYRRCVEAWMRVIRRTMRAKTLEIVPAALWLCRYDEDARHRLWSIAAAVEMLEWAPDPVTAG